MKEDYLAFVITMVDILDGASYLFDKKPDSDNRHWKEKLELEEYRRALNMDAKKAKHGCKKIGCEKVN